MATFGFKTAGIKLKKKVNIALSKKFMNKVGGILADDIVRRTRLGYGVAKKEGKRTRLKKLSKPYIKFRKKNRGVLSKFATPSKSNLTLTGQMLDSLTAKSRRVGRVELSFKGTHKNLDGSTMSNAKLADIMAKGSKRKNVPARPFIGPTNREVQRLKTNIKNQILKFL